MGLMSRLVVSFVALAFAYWGVTKLIITYGYFALFTYIFIGVSVLFLTWITWNLVVHKDG